MNGRVIRLPAAGPVQMGPRVSGGDCCVSEFVHIRLGGSPSGSNMTYMGLATQEIIDHYQDIGAFPLDHDPYAFIEARAWTAGIFASDRERFFTYGFRLAPGLWQVEAKVEFDAEVFEHHGSPVAVWIEALVQDPFNRAARVIGLSEGYPTFGDGWTYAEGRMTGTIGVEGDSQDDWWTPALWCDWWMLGPTNYASLWCEMSLTKLIHAGAIMTETKQRDRIIAPSCDCPVTPMPQPANPSAS